MAKNTTAVATAADIAVPATNALPSYMNQNTGRGNENVEAGHLQIPRLKLLQKMSDEVDRHHPGYIEGAKDGDFMNDLTKEIYGTEVFVISLKFKDEFVVWKKRTAGGGFGGSFATDALGREFVAKQDKPDDWDVNQTHSHLLLLKNPETGALSKPILMDFSSSKLSVSRNWNSQIDIKGGDRFSSLWKLTAVATKSKSGQPFMNLKPDYMGWVTEEDYRTAEKFYEQFSR